MFKSRTHYINHYRRFINLERDADIERHEAEIQNLSATQREKKGRALLNMRGRRAGHFYGNQQLVKFMKSEVSTSLPELDMSIGDVVVLSLGEPLKKGNPLGTIVDKSRYSVTVMFEGMPEKWLIKRGTRIDLYINDVTYRRMQEALDTVMYGRETSPRLIDWLIAEKDKYIKPLSGSHEGKYERVHSSKIVEWNNEKLNDSQKEAVTRAMEAKDFHIIHGPPGTGKTVTGVEVLYQAAKKYNQILATADSNGAVDNLLEGLVNAGVKVVRLGQVFKVSAHLKGHTLDEQVMADPAYVEIENLRQQAFTRMKDQEGLKHPSQRWTRGLRNNEIHKLAKRGKGSRGVSSTDMKQMSKWLVIREDIDKYFEKADALEGELIQSILKCSDVVLSTNSGAGQALLEGVEFDFVLIDEATQATESSTFIPAVKGKRLVLLGDHKQLPPTVISEEAVEKGFSISLLERLVDRYSNAVVSMLTIQYRMNDDILKFPNSAFYDGLLKSADSNQNWEVTFMPDSFKDLKSRVVFETLGLSREIFIDVKGREKRLGDGPSIFNMEESDIVVQLVQDLLEVKLTADQIGVISPYKAQTKLIRDKLGSAGVQVDTVDGFQGREKEVIIISLVRSNSDAQMGFLKDIRRLNVALTRAKKLRIVVGGAKTIKTNPIYKSFLESTMVISADIM